MGWANSTGENRTLWENDARLELTASPAVAAVAWITRSGETVWQVTKTGERPGRLAKSRALAEAMQTARTARRAIVSEPFPLAGGVLGFAIVIPVQGVYGFSGCLVEAIGFDELLGPLADARRFAIDARDGRVQVYRTAESLTSGVPASEASIALDGRSWRVRVWPSQQLLERESSPIRVIVLITGLVMSGLVGLAIFLAQTSASRAAESRRVNEALRVENERRARVERELASARDAALSATRAKSAFLATVSHEIRTPMNGVVGTSSLLLETALQPDQREYAEQIARSADNLLTIINDILDVSKIEAGKLTIEAVDLDLRGTIDDAFEVVAPAAQKKRLELCTLVEPAVPDRLRGDPSRLRQMLLNLLGNAVKFTDAGSITLIVEPAAG